LQTVSSEVSNPRREVSGGCDGYRQGLAQKFRRGRRNVNTFMEEEDFPTMKPISNRSTVAPQLDGGGAAASALTRSRYGGLKNTYDRVEKDRGSNPKSRRQQHPKGMALLEKICGSSKKRGGGDNVPT